MKNIKNKIAFTLIELLVVITIIGILATGAVSVFTTQLQGARDSGRIGDLKTMETALHQIFSDESAYPKFTNSGAFKNDIKPFVSKDLKDPKHGKGVCWKTDGDSTQDCQGYYGVYSDSFNLEYAAFKLGVHFEKETNYKQKAKAGGKDWDGGNIDNMYEVYAGAGASSGSLAPTANVSGVVY